jgi:hypothetical protein
VYPFLIIHKCVSCVIIHKCVCVLCVGACVCVCVYVRHVATSLALHQSVDRRSTNESYACCMLYMPEDIRNV